MFLTQISYNNFRCLEDRKIEFDKNINIIYGKNGQGKTSLIEAIYFLGTGKSFRTKKTKEIFRYNTNRLITFGTFFDRNDNKKNIAIDVNLERKDFYIDKDKNRYVDYIGTLNVISFIPEDVEIIIGNPSTRRNFFNYEISQAKKEYLKNLIEFEKLLKIRNKMIKEKNIKNDLFKIYNEKFIEDGSKILFQRREFVKKLSILLNLNYRKLFDEKSELKLKYNCFLGNIDKLSLEEIEKKFFDFSDKKKERELYLGYSLVGPQKDDFEFELNGKNAKSFSSQGEKKSIIFALKISEIDILVKEKNEFPIFLLDDIASYFDEIRKGKILTYFENKSIQCFITSTEDLKIKGKKIFIEKGKVV